MITEHPLDFDVSTIVEQKLVWYDIGRIVIYTGSDIPESQTTRLIEISQFRERFTDAEKDAILDLAYNGDVIARRILLKLQTTALEINVDHPDVIASLAYLVSVGAITDSRKTAILTP